MLEAFRQMLGESERTSQEIAAVIAERRAAAGARRADR